MALQGQPVDVPLVPMNQQATATGGPVGRLKRLVNAIAKKIGRTADGIRLRAEKRDGFEQLPTAVRDPATGLTSSKALANAELLTTFREQLLGVFSAAPFVLSEAAAAWESPTYTLPTQVLRERKIYSANGLMTTCDSTRIGARTFYVWVDKSLGIVYGTILDDDGTVIKTVASVNTGTTTVEAKVANDGVRFWLVVRNFIGTDLLTAIAVDVNGQTLGALAVATTANSYFDVIASPAVLADGVFVAQKGALGDILLQRFTWNGAAVVNSGAAINFVPCSTGRMAFLRNDSSDGNLYLATASGANDHYVFQLTTPAATPGNGHQYNVSLGAAAFAFQIAGFVAPTGNKDITVTLSFLDTTPVPQLNSTQVRTVTFAGVTTLQRTQRSLTLVSRVFPMAGFYYAVMYYRSTPELFTNVAQSTFFLVCLSAPWQVCGRWEFGTAFADWADTATVSWYMSLSSPQVAADGGIHIALPYRAVSTTALTIEGDVFAQVRHTVDVTGLKDFSFGPDFGRALDLGDAVLLPGPQATAYSGAAFAEDGIPLLFEVSTQPTQQTTGNLTQLGTYEFVIVAEWTDAAGNRVRGPAGPPVTVTLTGANDQITIVGYMIHTTQKQQILVSVYRTVMINGIQSTQHYKVSGTLVGGAFGGPTVYNDDSASTWTFVDTMADAAARINEQLYVDNGALDRFPAPPFSVGCRAANRAFVVAPDNAIWFSGEKTEGDPYWFTPAFRILLPTAEKVKAIQQLDTFLLVMCERSAIFSIPLGSFPDATGAGAIPSPTLLPFTNGCTGFAEVTDQGVMYSSVQGGIWIITRDLRNVYIGAAVEDDTASGIIGSAADDKGRIMFATLAGSMVVYDDVTEVWSTWASGAFSTGLTCPAVAHKGRLTLLSSIPAAAWRQKVGQYNDNGLGILSTVRIDFMRFAGIRGYVRTWDAQFQGVYLGDHDLTVTGYVDDSETPSETYQLTPPGAVPGTPYVHKLPPRIELAVARAYEFSDSFPRGTSQGFALESMSFFVGVEKGLARLPATSSIKPT